MTRLVLVFLAALLVGASAHAQDTVLRCGAVFDGDAMNGAGEIVVRDGRIVSGPAGAVMRRWWISPGTPACRVSSTSTPTSRSTRTP